MNKHAETFDTLKNEIATQIVGQHDLIERLLIALVAGGHVLLEGVPGLAKTRTLSCLGQCLGTEIKRVQFTPDLLPSDLIGTHVYRPQTGDFVLRHGPIFTNILLADEINRAPAKVQSALLQSMAEGEVTIGEETLELPRPFFVLATQNPIEQEGTYPLPEAQMDRFLMKVTVTYPSYEEELDILKLTASDVVESKTASQVLTVEELLTLQKEVLEVFVDQKIDQYIVSLVQASRNTEKLKLKGMVDWGASPRASIALRRSAQALSFIRHKDFVSPDEVKEVAYDVLRHRILPSFEAEARGITSDEIVRILLENTSLP
jgi:MoxR-like ATPase